MHDILCACNDCVNSKGPIVRVANIKPLKAVSYLDLDMLKPPDNTYTEYQLAKKFVTCDGVVVYTYYMYKPIGVGR